MIFSSPKESFFKSPTESPSDQGDGILFHLRRDLEKLYGKEDDFTSDPTAYALLAMMGILAGIDYLSKVYSSNTEQKSRQRMVETLKDLCALDTENAEVLYQFRCGLVHSVSLSTVSACRFKMGNKFAFKVTDQVGVPLITKLSEDGNETEYRISFWELKRCFTKAIGSLLTIYSNPSHPRNQHVVKMVGQLHSEKILKKITISNPGV